MPIDGHPGNAPASPLEWPNGEPDDHAPYHVPDWDVDIEAQALIDSVPDDVSHSGFMLKHIKDLVPQYQVGLDYKALGDYPTQDLMRLQVQVAGVLYPDLKLPRALRYIARDIFSQTNSTLIGTVLYAAVGRHPERILRASPLLYGMIHRKGEMRILSIAPNVAEMHFSEHWAFPEYNLYGTIEGAFNMCGVTYEIEVADDGKGGVYTRTRWQ
jgi:uncharacterized protein (TIGR02265 family)